MQLELTAVAVEISVAQMLKLHLSYLKVSVAVAAGADYHILRLALNVAEQLDSHVSHCHESLSPLIPPPLTSGSCRRLYMLLSPAFAQGMKTAWFSFMQTGPCWSTEECPEAVVGLVTY